jgi:hypothetical protein
MKREYHIKDDVNEIRKACSYLEGLGFACTLEDDFIVKYERKDHIILIEYERYGESVFIDLIFKNPKYGKQKYSIGWSAKVDDDVDFTKYVEQPYSKILVVKKMIQFIEDFPDKIFDEEYCYKMKLKYDNLPV